MFDNEKYCNIAKILLDSLIKGWLLIVIFYYKRYY